MSKAIILHTLLRLVRPSSITIFIMLVFGIPMLFITSMNRISAVFFDLNALLGLLLNPFMIAFVTFLFLDNSVGNTKSLDDGEYLAVLFSRPLFRWKYIISKWFIGSLLTMVIIGLQLLGFITLLLCVGKANQISIGFIDIFNLILNSLEAAALIVMVLSFPSRMGKPLFAVLVALSFAISPLLGSLSGSKFWLNDGIRNIGNTITTMCHSFLYSPIDLDQYFNSVQILWLPAFSFVSNIFLYLWIAITVMNNREFFYTN